MRRFGRDSQTLNVIYKLDGDLRPGEELRMRGRSPSTVEVIRRVGRRSVVALNV